jgi:hypothetical protein
MTRTGNIGIDRVLYTLLEVRVLLLAVGSVYTYSV